MTDIEINNMTDRDLLVIAVSKINQLASDLATVSTGTGFPRCVVRGKQLEDLTSHFRWLRNSYLGGLLVALGAALAHFFK